jgi:beta-1,4-mannosyltransferase
LLYFDLCSIASYSLQQFFREQLTDCARGRQIILHDRPPAHFCRTPVADKHNLFLRLVPSLSRPIPGAFFSSRGSSTPLTRHSSAGTPEDSPDRPALLVSSTSWTADEDFSPLLTAIDEYASASDRSLPKLLILITGKGALRSAFDAEILKREKVWDTDRICVRTVFLAAEDYPVLLGCADLGISMHSSSSGRDLPMKVVDMFGCGVPVLARDFAAIGELVLEGRNGRTWTTGQELGRHIVVSWRIDPVL